MLFCGNHLTSIWTRAALENIAVRHQIEVLNRSARKRSWLREALAEMRASLRAVFLRLAPGAWLSMAAAFGLAAVVMVQFVVRSD